MSQAASAGSSSGGSSNDAMGVIVVLFIMTIILILLWPFYRPHFVRSVVAVATVEAGMVLSLKPILPSGYVADLNNVRETGKRLLNSSGDKKTNFKNVPVKDALQFWSIPSRALMPFFLVGSVLAMWHVKSTNLAARFRTRYSLEDLIRAQAHFYPHLRPILQEKIDDLPMRDGPWRIKYTQSEFAIKNQLLLDGARKVVTDFEYAHKAAYFNGERAKLVFIKQLGPRWMNDPKDLLPHELGMFGVMCAMACVDRKGAMEALEEMSLTWKTAKAKKGAQPTYTLSTKKGEALAAKYWDHKTVKRVRNAHAYLYTVMAALADLKLNSGELCISHFIWLRPTDPGLFYVLHQQGLPLPNYEAAAAWSHYKTEVRMGFKLIAPQIDKAVEGLKLALIEEGWLNAKRPVLGDAASGAERERAAREWIAADATPA